ncbi:MAG: acetyl-CoA decarbonylase/synthase complex subunit delta [Deltaproteobacteria bacterium]|nr:MAG: acetyl-CoA decarbonylase/synthase complex subunit delta [Deltaproteobacteria bacterium]
MEIEKIKYTGKVKEISIGKEGKAITVGGENSYPFYLFEGEMPHKPKIAMEVYDSAPEEWAEAALEPFKDVSGDPAAWAKKCVEECGADAIALRLASTDPNTKNTSPEQAVEVVKKVAEAINVPLIVLGSGNAEKNTAVLRKVAEECDGLNLTLGPVEESNYKQIGAAAIGFKHTIIANTPIDINLAKELNVLLGNLGVPDGSILMDPTTGALGYGMEYTYSVMERDRMAALTQEDEKLQFPMLNDIGTEVWKIKEAKIPEKEEPKLGDAKKRGILIEAVTAVSFLLAGSDILVMRHPEAVKLVRSIIEDLTAT